MRTTDQTAGVDLDRMHAIEERARQDHAAERDLFDRSREAGQEVRRLEMAVARTVEEMRTARIRVEVGSPPLVDIVAGLEADLALAQTTAARLNAELAMVRARWNGRQLLAERCRKYARQQVGPVALGEQPAIIREEGGDHAAAR